VDRKDKKVKRKASGIVINIVLALAILLVVVSTASMFVIDKYDTFIFGYKPFIVSSESMAPEIQKYAIAIIKKTGYDEVKVGDKIAFRADLLGGAPAFHRVIEVTPEGFITKGDANNVADDQIVIRETFIGKEVWHTNVMAKLIPLLKTPKGVLMIVALPICLAALLVVFVKALKRYLRR
jgi:signal peptidase